MGMGDPEKFSPLGLEMCILMHSPTHLMSVWRTSRSRPAARLHSLTFQAGWQWLKGTGVPAEDGTERYLPWRWVRDKFANAEILRRRLQLSQLFFRRSRVSAGHGPL